MPPVSGLRQPTLVRLALEKLDPANGPAEKMSGFCGDSGSTVAAPSSSRVRAIRLRPALTTSSPESSRVRIVWSSSRISWYLRIGRLLVGRVVDARKPGQCIRTDASGSIREETMNGSRGVALVLALVLCTTIALVPAPATAQARPEGEMRWALYVTLSPQWFDPAEVVGVLTPFWVMYAMHDALVKPMPGNQLTPSLAESWTVSPDHKTYEFKLREGLKFHNGDPFTTEDVQFSFQRAKGAKILQEKVREISIVDRYRIRFHLKEPWPDFMTFYGTLATS